MEFLNRLESGELALREQGLWDVPHPWLNIDVPGSRILDFDVSVFRDILPKLNQTAGPILVYTITRSK